MPMMNILKTIASSPVKHSNFNKEEKCLPNVNENEELTRHSKWDGGSDGQGSDLTNQHSPRSTMNQSEESNDQSSHEEQTSVFDERAIEQVLAHFADLAHERDMNGLVAQLESKNKRVAAKMRRGKTTNSSKLLLDDEELTEPMAYSAHQRSHSAGSTNVLSIMRIQKSTSAKAQRHPSSSTANSSQDSGHHSPGSTHNNAFQTAKNYIRRKFIRNSSISCDQNEKNIEFNNNNNNNSAPTSNGPTMCVYSPPQSYHMSTARRSGTLKTRLSMDEARRLMQDDDDECVKFASEENESHSANGISDKLLNYRQKSPGGECVSSMSTTHLATPEFDLSPESSPEPNQFFPNDAGHQDRIVKPYNSRSLPRHILLSTTHTNNKNIYEMQQALSVLTTELQAMRQHDANILRELQTLESNVNRLRDATPERPISSNSIAPITPYNKSATHCKMPPPIAPKPILQK